MKDIVSDVAICLSKLNKGIVIIPPNVFNPINNYMLKINKLERCKGLRKIVSPEFYDHFIKTYYDENRLRYKEDINDIEILRKLVEKSEIDRNIFPHSIFLRCMKKYEQLGENIDWWMPEEILQNFNELILKSNLITGIYILNDESHVKRLVDQFEKFDIRYLIVMDYLNDGIEHSLTISMESRSYKFGIISKDPVVKDWELPSEILEKYPHEIFKGTRYINYYMKISNQEDFDNFSFEIERSGFLIINYGSVAFQMFPRLASDLVKWEKQNNLEILRNKHQQEYPNRKPIERLSNSYYPGYSVSNLDEFLNPSSISKKSSEFSLDRSVQEKLKQLEGINGIHGDFFSDLHKFGVFAFLGFASKYYDLFKSVLLKDPNDLNKDLVTIGMSYKEIEQKLKLKNSQQKIIPVGSMSLILAEKFTDYYRWLIIQDDGYKSLLRNWITTLDVTRKCSICGKYYLLRDIPYNLYCASGIEECCFRCEIVEFPAKEELPQKISDFVRTCGFIPNAFDTFENFQFVSRIPDNRRKEAIISWAKMGRQQHVIDNYGSWFEGLVYAGILKDNLLPTKRGTMCLASDGHVCLSLAEREIDEWLISHNIPHDREPFYPLHRKYNPVQLMKADWKVGDTYIEYFGLTGDQDYDTRTGTKIELIKNLKLQTIFIFPKDLKKIDRVLNILLSK